MKRIHLILFLSAFVLIASATLASAQSMDTVWVSGTLDIPSLTS